MAVVLGAVAVGLILLIPALAILRESQRLAALPPRPTFDPDAALEWVVQHLADHAAAQLTGDDVRVILDLQLQYFKAKGVSQNGSTGHPIRPAQVFKAKGRAENRLAAHPDRPGGHRRLGDGELHPRAGRGPGGRV